MRITKPAGVAWRFMDGKPGHEHQSEGLLNALQRHLNLEIHQLKSSTGLTATRYWITGRFPPGESLPPPDLIIGAGHATHLPMLAARRARGGRVAVLMKPSLPASFFDLCLIPRHDEVTGSERIVQTYGVINHIRPACDPAPDRGLILIGGPSTHYRWDDQQIIDQISALVMHADNIKWTLSNSRRTPLAFMDRLALLDFHALDIVPFNSTTTEWLPEQFNKTSTAWVTEDSISMVYEALTAGISVGVLAIPRHHSSRVSRDLDQLISSSQVTSFQAWKTGKALSPPTAPVNEAVRCADIIFQRWFSETMNQAGNKRAS